VDDWSFAPSGESVQAADREFAVVESLRYSLSSLRTLYRAAAPKVATWRVRAQGGLSG
jgi:hypothetical protein